MDRSENMRAIRGKNTKPEMEVRRLVHKMGYRYRLHSSDLPGKPDLAFRAQRKVIFVHGCFWHSHACKSGLIPNSNQEFWLPKLRKNKERDARNLDTLSQKGWKALVIWECQLKDVPELRRTLKQFLGGKKATNSSAK